MLLLEIEHKLWVYEEAVLKLIFLQGAQKTKCGSLSALSRSISNIQLIINVTESDGVI